MKKVEITGQNVVLSFTKGEFDVICELFEDRSIECSLDVETFRAIPVADRDTLYIQRCILICKMAAQLRDLFVDVHVVGAPCPFDDSYEG